MRTAVIVLAVAVVGLAAALAISMTSPSPQCEAATQRYSTVPGLDAFERSALRTEMSIHC